MENIDAAFKAEEEECISTTSDLRSTRCTIGLQALMYILVAFFLTWVFVVSDIISSGGDARYLSVLKLIFLPLQGFWNMLIFLYHKISLVLKYDSDATIWDAIMIVFSTNKDVNRDNLHHVLNLGMVEMHCYEKSLREIVDGASPGELEPSHPSGSRQVGNSKTANFFADEERRGSMKIASPLNNSTPDNSGSINADIDFDRCEEEGDLKEMVLESHIMR